MTLNAERSNPKPVAAAASSANPSAGADGAPQHARRPALWSLQWGRQFARRLQDNARWMKQFLHGRK